MGIGKGKPLLAHTKIDYHECLCKLILERFFPNRYKDLVLSDKPDLQGDGVGIEVTSADSEAYREAETNMVKAAYCEDKAQKALFAERMKQLGYEYTEPVQVWPSYEPSFKETKSVVETKIGKLKRGYYKAFPRYELFIYTNMYYDEKVTNEAKKFFFETLCDRYFMTVYILSQGTELHTFEIENGQYSYTEILGGEQHELAEKAYQIVVDKENEE